jgi:hypothetical protein
LLARGLWRASVTVTWPTEGKYGDFGALGVLKGDVCMRKKVCSYDFGLLGSVLEGFGLMLRPWWLFRVARKRALEGFCDCSSKIIKTKKAI